MNNREFRIFLGSSILCLAMAGSTSADPVGLVVKNVTTFSSPPGTWTCKVYVQFDDPSDRLLSVALSNIRTNDPSGFYQHPQGLSDTAPPQFLVDLYPDLAYDSFVTIGLDVVPIGGADGTNPDPDWDSWQFNNNGQTSGGWYNGAPSNGQGDPDANLQVLVAQLTIDKGSFIVGDVSVLYNSGWQVFSDCFQFYPCFTCVGDLNCDESVDQADLVILRAALGPNPCHPADLNGDGVVDRADEDILRSNWGRCPSIGT